LFACDCTGFSYHAFKIIILYFTNKQFQSKFKEVFGGNKEASHK